MWLSQTLPAPLSGSDIDWIDSQSAKVPLGTRGLGVPSFLVLDPLYSQGALAINELLVGARHYAGSRELNTNS